LLPERIDEYVSEDNPVRADRGYFKSEEIFACHEAGIVPIVPKSLTSTAAFAGRFDREAFRYVPRLDEYRCPANQRLTRRTTMTERGLTLYRYWSSNCGSCVLKARCTPGTERRVTRWEHEEVLVTMQRRLDRDPTKLSMSSGSVTASVET
jgi:transposase